MVQKPPVPCMPYSNFPSANKEERRRWFYALFIAFVFHLILIFIPFKVEKHYKARKSFPTKVYRFSTIQVLKDSPTIPRWQRTNHQKQLKPIPGPEIEEPEKSSLTETIPLPPDLPVGDYATDGLPDGLPGEGGIASLLCDVPPKVISYTKIEPEYPQSLINKGISGQVVIEVLILKDGLLDENSIKVIKSPHPKLTELSITALKKWRFKPGMYKGEPVDVYFTAVFDFVLPENL